VLHHSQGHLSEIILTGRSTGRFTGLLNRWQKQTNEHTDDGNHHQ